ncbi:ASCH domain-containing protein [Variovorax sp. EBFNA2]|uniref:ASCH domain-containing protein n=1 Tax=Variovorax sp. EBFNA2 TaxID=3342097 RepID=UPI0029C06753|nr:ASCH domain-containing protein [Variovorax boronicumulans]WPG35166.1 ASCH domain-containing protein [Variovorax boronicumulans]
MKALSIRQPWAWLIVNAHKDVENRTWSTAHRGEFLVHASKGMTAREYQEARRFLATDHRLKHLVEILPPAGELERGGIVGSAHLVETDVQLWSPWYMGYIGFVLRDAKPLPFIPLKGALGFFDVELPQ